MITLSATPLPTVGMLLIDLFGKWTTVGSMTFPCMQLLHTITSLTALRLTLFRLVVATE